MKRGKKARVKNKKKKRKGDKRRKGREGEKGKDPNFLHQWVRHVVYFVVYRTPSDVTWLEDFLTSK